MKQNVYQPFITKRCRQL